MSGLLRGAQLCGTGLGIKTTVCPSAFNLSGCAPTEEVVGTLQGKRVLRGR